MYYTCMACVQLVHMIIAKILSTFDFSNGDSDGFDFQ